MAYLTNIVFVGIVQGMMEDVWEAINVKYEFREKT